MTLMKRSDSPSSEHWFFPISLGDFSESLVALWSSKTFQLLSSVSMSGPIHDTAFSPSVASQLACAGSHGVYFCLIHMHGSDVELKVSGHRTKWRCLNVVFLLSTSKCCLCFPWHKHNNSVFCCRFRRWKHQQRWVTWSLLLCRTTWILFCWPPLTEDMFASGMLTLNIALWPGKLNRARLVKKK